MKTAVTAIILHTQRNSLSPVRDNGYKLQITETPKAFPISNGVSKNLLGLNKALGIKRQGLFIWDIPHLFAYEVSLRSAKMRGFIFVNIVRFLA